jgi:hypothetical protein
MSEARHLVEPIIRTGAGIAPASRAFQTLRTESPILAATSFTVSNWFSLVFVVITESLVLQSGPIAWLASVLRNCAENFKGFEQSP